MAVDAPVLLALPADGVPELIATPAQLRRAVAAIASGTGPVAVDAERASGFRYRQRAYLVQLRRAGAGTTLIDPVELPSLSSLDAAIGDAEWVLHAANQDLPCLAELGLHPKRLFDTELAGRLLGDDRVALGTMVERHLGIRLEKGFAAADWSARPLGEELLAYAALDVELLIPLAAALREELTRTAKLDWAEQEFEAVRRAPTPAPRADPWRRTSGIHGLHRRRQLAAVRALWYARDELAAASDLAPGRVLPDAAIIAAARANPRRFDDLLALPAFQRARQRRQAARWMAALQQARRLSRDQLPPISAERTRVPSRRWRDQDPQASARLARTREALDALAAERSVLTQNLLASHIVRQLAWAPPNALDEAAVRAELAALGARPWQIELTARQLTAALTDAE
ncbi:MAG: HRDC domain-containing protein [Actinomycetia bacterium]|nr:HRDC domain-containing protein [Actinomycetes bacterium]